MYFGELIYEVEERSQIHVKAGARPEFVKRKSVYVIEVDGAAPGTCCGWWWPMKVAEHEPGGVSKAGLHCARW